MDYFFKRLARQTSESAVNAAIDELFTQYDRDNLQWDELAWFLTLNYLVTPEVEAECREELRLAAQRGWKRLRNLR